jgi:hypothetical protein
LTHHDDAVKQCQPYVKEASKRAYGELEEEEKKKAEEAEDRADDANEA